MRAGAAVFIMAPGSRAVWLQAHVDALYVIADRLPFGFPVLPFARSRRRRQLLCSWLLRSSRLPSLEIPFERLYINVSPGWDSL